MLARIKKNDLVAVLSGKDKGKQGTVIEVLPHSDKVVVRGVAVHTKHRKAKKSDEVSAIRKEEGAIHLSKVQPICHSCKKPTRITVKRTEDKAQRVCVRCQEAFE
jgi:large subunit ribosomal protein L24